MASSSPHRPATDNEIDHFLHDVDVRHFEIALEGVPMPFVPGCPSMGAPLASVSWKRLFLWS
jgi:hypothetical protein